MRRPVPVTIFWLLILGVLATAPVGCENHGSGGGGSPFPVGALGDLPTGGIGLVVHSNNIEGYGYDAYIPASYDEDADHPMLVVMHGTGGTPTGMINLWAGLADDEAVILLAPSYIDNDTYFTLAGDQAVFDMMEEVEDYYGVDRRRRYVNGLSTGGSWSFVFGLSYARSVAAGSVFAGGYTGDNDLLVAFASRKIPYHLIHGSADGVLSVTHARDAADALDFHDHPVEYVEHGGGHSVPASSPSDAWEFMKDYELLSDP